MRRLPRTIDKPTELLGFRMDEIGVFVSVLLVFLLVDWLPSDIALSYTFITRFAGGVARPRVLVSPNNSVHLAGPRPAKREPL